jgi:hypothetical protein
MLYSEIIAVCSQIHTKHINTLCGQNVELLNVKRGGTYSNHWALKDLTSCQWTGPCVAAAWQCAQTTQLASCPHCHMAPPPPYLHYTQTKRPTLKDTAVLLLANSPLTVLMVGRLDPQHFWYTAPVTPCRLLRSCRRFVGLYIARWVRPAFSGSSVDVSLRVIVLSHSCWPLFCL